MTNYSNGANKERRFMKMLKEKGWDIVFRSAGSHSEIDIAAIHFKKKRIFFLQSKQKGFTDGAKEKLMKENTKLNDEFICNFFVVRTPEELRNIMIVADVLD